MICNLHIKNIGIIDDLSIDLNNGFNVLTGETGAGKTLIIRTKINNSSQEVVVHAFNPSTQKAKAGRSL